MNKCWLLRFIAFIYRLLGRLARKQSIFFRPKMYTIPFRIHFLKVCFFKVCDSNHPSLKLETEKVVKWEPFSKYSIEKKDFKSFQIISKGIRTESCVSNNLWGKLRKKKEMRKICCETESIWELCAIIFNWVKYALKVDS